MTDWDDAIIKSLKGLGGKATNKQIYEQIKNHVILDKTLLKPYYGNIRYHNIVRTHLTALKNKGVIRSPQPGLHELVGSK